MHRVLFPILIVATLMPFRTLVVVGDPQVPCYFIFGDSLVDNGNNNRLDTAAKANYPPYGVDFSQGSTGRFTNGATIADVIGQHLGFLNFIPPYATATNQEISTGVNYGSGSAGIRAESGRDLGERISLDRQLLNHASIISRLSLLQRNNTFTNEYMKKCVYIVNMGSNDYINNYFIPTNYSASRTYTTDQFAAVLVRQYCQQLTTLYRFGARKVAVFGLGLIGCAPAVIEAFGTQGKPCVQSINDGAKLFNDRLKPLVDNLNNHFSDARFTFINVTSISEPREGVALSNSPSCEVRSDGQCVPNTVPFLDRATSIWYDGFHPTTFANTEVATRSYNALFPMDASPYDISHLARL